MAWRFLGIWRIVGLHFHVSKWPTITLLFHCYLGSSVHFNWTSYKISSELPTLTLTGIFSFGNHWNTHGDYINFHQFNHISPNPSRGCLHRWKLKTPSNTHNAAVAVSLTLLFASCHVTPVYVVLLLTWAAPFRRSPLPWARLIL